MNGPQPALSDLQLARVFRDAGFIGNALVTMVAVSLAESGGDPDNVGDESLANATWGPSIGLGQIRSLWADRGTGRSRDPDRLTDPAFNARSAYAISSGGTNFRPWTMWVNQGYQRFLERANTAVAGLKGGKAPAISGLTGSLGGVEGGLSDLAGKVIEPLVAGAGRIVLGGLVIAGGVMLVAAGAWRGTAPIRARTQDAMLGSVA